MFVSLGSKIFCTQSAIRILQSSRGCVHTARAGPGRVELFALYQVRVQWANRVTIATAVTNPVALP
jgi:hypothetical protein